MSSTQMKWGFLLSDSNAEYLHVHDIFPWSNSNAEYLHVYDIFPWSNSNAEYQHDVFLWSDQTHLICFHGVVLT